MVDYQIVINKIYSFDCFRTSRWWKTRNDGGRAWNTNKGKKLIKNMWLDHSPKSVESPFPESFSIQYKYEDGLKIATHKNKDVLIIFAGHGSVNSHHLQNAIFHNAFDNVHKKYIIIWLYVDTPQSGEASRNLDIETSVYKSNIQPYSVILKNGKIINTYDGFSTLDLNRYRNFLKI